MSQSREIKINTTKPIEIAFAIYKGSCHKVVETFQRIVSLIIERGYVVAGPPINILHNDPIVTPEDEQITELRFPIREIT